MSDERINKQQNDDAIPNEPIYGPEEVRAQAEEALVDAALREVAGDEQPTDLTEAILTKAEDLKTTPAESVEVASSTSRGWLRAGMAIAAVLLVGTFVLPAIQGTHEAARLTDDALEKPIAQPIRKQAVLDGKDDFDYQENEQAAVVDESSVVKTELALGKKLDAKQEELRRFDTSGQVDSFAGAAISPAQQAQSQRDGDVDSLGFDSIGSAGVGVAGKISSGVQVTKNLPAISTTNDRLLRQDSSDSNSENLGTVDESIIDGRSAGVAAEAAPAPSSAPARGSELARRERERFVPDNKIGLQGLITDAMREAVTSAGETKANSKAPTKVPKPGLSPSLPSPYYRTDDLQYYAKRDNKLSSTSGYERQSGLGDKDRYRFAYRDKKWFFQEEESLGRQPVEPRSGDRYTPIYENSFLNCKGQEALSTFSIDVDTASYANTRQFLMQSNRLPHPDAVRLEEFVNYFDYDYEKPEADSETPFTANMEVASCPWQPQHRLVRIALKGREVKQDKRPLSNLVFLVDVSGSMNQENKLPLVVRGLKKLTRQLGENDRVAIVVYASSEGMVLDSTPGSERELILSSLNRLAAGGSTAGGAGIRLAYKIAEENFIEGGTNRVLLCTDGDFNVGISNTQALGDMVEAKAKETKVFLSVLGFGRGNLNDAMMETISNRGNGNYSYIDNALEARKVLVEQMTGTLVTIAKDVKIQVEFNPAKVSSYRLLGYENRVMANEDFNDDTKDAGEIGAGHTVTAFYEVVPKGVVLPEGVDPLKYQQVEQEDAEEDAYEEPAGEASNEMLTLKLRYKQPDEDESTKIEFTLVDEGKSFAKASDDFRFAASVTEFGLLLRNSKHRGKANFDSVRTNCESSLGEDKHGYREEFLDLVDNAVKLSGGE